MVARTLGVAGSMYRGAPAIPGQRWPHEARTQPHLLVIRNNKRVHSFPSAGKQQVCVEGNLSFRPLRFWGLDFALLANRLLSGTVQHRLRRAQPRVVWVRAREAAQGAGVHTIRNGQKNTPLKTTAGLRVDGGKGRG